MVKTKSRPNCARTKPVAPTVEDQIDAALAASIAPAAPQPVIPLPSFSPYELAKLAYGYDRRCDEIQDQISELVKSAPSVPGKDMDGIVSDGKRRLHRHRLEDQGNLWSERCRATEDLLPLFPAKTLGDAAVQLSYALRTLDRINDKQSGAENAALAQKAEQLVLWAFEAVASASERPLCDVMDLWPFKRLAYAHGDFKRADAIGSAMLGSRAEQAPYYRLALAKTAPSPVAQAFSDYREASEHSKASLAEWDGCGEPDKETALEAIWTAAFTAREQAFERLIALPAGSMEDLASKAEAALELACDETSAIRDAGLEGHACVRVIEDMLALMGAPR